MNAIIVPRLDLFQEQIQKCRSRQQFQRTHKVEAFLKAERLVRLISPGIWNDSAACARKAGNGRTGRSRRLFHIVGKWGSVAGFGHFAFCYYGRQHTVSNS